MMTSARKGNPMRNALVFIGSLALLIGLTICIFNMGRHIGKIEAREQTIRDIEEGRLFARSRR
jgi:hypothetical protein